MSQTEPPGGDWSGAEPAADATPPAAVASPVEAASVQPDPGKARGGSDLVRKLAIPVIIVLVIVMGAVALRDRLSGSSSDLAVGDCFDAPSPADTAATGADIGDVQHHPCTEAHGYEVFAVLKHPAANGDPYPGIDALFSYADTNCLPPFAVYVGVEYPQSTLRAGSVVPKQEGWDRGARTITCYVGGADGGPVSGSLKGSKK